MISSFETQRSVWTWRLLLLGAVCCCSGLPHQQTDNMADQMQSVSKMTKQQQTAVVDLGSLLDGAMVSLVAGETRLAVHRAVLEARSPVLTAMLHPGTPEGCNGEVAILDMEGPVLRQLVAFLYTGRGPQLPGMALPLLVAAQKYSLTGLRDICERLVADQLSVENAVATAVLAVRHKYLSLRQAAVCFIKQHLEVMATKAWVYAVHNHPGEVVEFTRLLADTCTTTTAGCTLTADTTGCTPAAAITGCTPTAPTTGCTPTAATTTTVDSEAATADSRPTAATTAPTVTTTATTTTATTAAPTAAITTATPTAATTTAAPTTATPTAATTTAAPNATTTTTVPTAATTTAAPTAITTTATTTTATTTTTTAATTATTTAAITSATTTVPTAAKTAATTTAATTAATTTSATTATTTAATTAATTATTTAATTAATTIATMLSTVPTPDPAAVSRYRSLSADEKGNKLRLAAHQGKVEEVRALLAAGAAVDQRDSWRLTALHRAAEYNKPAVVRLLLASGADPNARTNKQWTPLHHAARAGYAEAAAALLEAGADRGARNDAGKTPVDLARQNNNQRLVELMQ